MEDWDADLSPCNFATTHVPAEINTFISLQLRDHPFNSLHPDFLSPLNFATHETEDPSFQKCPQYCWEFHDRL